MRKLLYCITAFLVATFFACSDSERNRQILLQAENCIEASPDSALAILEGIKYNDITSPEDRAVYSLLYTQARCKLMDIPESDSLIDSAISFFKANGDDRRLAVAYYYKGAVNYSRKKYETSVQFLKMAESLAEGADDELLKNKIYERLYIVNYVNENRRLALVYAKRFLESSLTFDDAELITRGCSGVASCFYLLGHADSTAVYLNKCVPYIDRLAPKLQASLWSYLAAVAYENRDVEQAERLLKKSFSIEEQPYANYIQGLMEFAAGNDDAARQCMEKALETDDEKLRGIIYERLAYYYNKNNIMGEAYDNILKKLDQLESAHDDGKQKKHY